MISTQSNLLYSMYSKPAEQLLVQVQLFSSPIPKITLLYRCHTPHFQKHQSNLSFSITLYISICIQLWKMNMDHLLNKSYVDEVTLKDQTHPENPGSTLS